MRVSKSSHNLFLLFIALGACAFLALLIMNLGVMDFTPSKAQAEFVKACGELNGKTFTYENVSTLKGQCYVPCGNNCVTVRACTETDVTNYLKGGKISASDDQKSTRLNISQKGLDGSWRCSLEQTDDNKIKAVPNFAHD
jgi:hypothetical protein